MPERRVGKVEHYYPKVKAAAVGLSGPLKVGDKVHIKGHGDDFEEEVTSLQLDHEPIEEGKPGQSVGLWVKERVHEGDDVFLVEKGGRGPPRGGEAGAAGRKAPGAKATPAGRRAPTRRQSSSRARKSARASRKAPKRNPKRTASRGRRPGQAKSRRSTAARRVKAKGTKRSGTARRTGRKAARRSSRRSR